MASSVIDVPLGTSAWQLQAMLDNARANDVFRLQAGNYYFDRTVFLNQSDVSLIGAGRGETNIYLTNSAIDAPVFQIGHKLHNPITLSTHYIDRVAHQGDTEINLTDASWLRKGDVIFIEQDNTDDWIREIGGTEWLPWRRNEDKPLRTLMAEVEDVQGNRVILDTPLTFDFDPTLTRVEKRWSVDNVTLSGFNLYGPLEADPENYNNRGDGHETYHHSMIVAAGTRDVHITDIEIHDAMSHGITVADTVDIDVANILVNGAFNKGEGGNGYAIWIRDVYDSSFTDLNIVDTRHAVLFASYTAASGNYVHVLDTNRDINFHGGPDQFNTVVVDIMRADDASHNAPGKELFFNEGEVYGVPTDADMNTVFIRSMVAEVESRLAVDRAGRIRSNGDEIFTGEGDDYASAGGGNDTIYGSEGDDTVDGGWGNDTFILPGLEREYVITRDAAGGLYFERSNDQTWVTDVELIRFRDASYTANQLWQDALDEKHPGDHPNEEIEGAGEIDEDPDTGGGTGGDGGGDTGGGDGGDTGEPDDPNSGATPATHLGWDEMDTSTLETPTSDDPWDNIWIDASSLIEEPFENASMKDTAHYILVGNDLENRFNGNYGHNRLEGRGGDDRLNGKDGNDTILGGTGDDDIDAGTGDDMVDGGDGDDTIEGGTGNDTIRASAGHDEIDGEKDEDSIIFAGSTTDYDLELDDDVYLFTNGDNHTYVENVEYFAFADGTFTLEHMELWAATGNAPVSDPDDPDTPPPIFDFPIVAPL